MKRGFDLLTAIAFLILSSPVLILICLIISIDSKGPIIFCQRRVGIDDKEFNMYKFRTMVVGTPEVATDKLSDSQRYITKVGYYLRKYSLDELPQFVNIILGDMALVGPRPALYNQHDLRQLRNNLGISKIRPGLTGWAQINGRDELPLEQKVKLDHFYLLNRSLVLDLKILFGTVFSVCNGTGTHVRANIDA